MFFTFLNEICRSFHNFGLHIFPAVNSSVLLFDEFLNEWLLFKQVLLNVLVHQDSARFITGL